MAVATMRQLLEAGIHFGHQTRRWNPKMARFIFGERNGIYIIDLQKTLRQLRKAYVFVRDTVAKGGTVLFVGTKKQAREAIAREAQRCGMFYVNNRWLGGTLTNYSTIRKSIQKLLDLEEMEESGKMDEYPKKEAIHLRKERDKLNSNLAGIKGMAGLPDIVFVVDAKKELIAVREAQRLQIPCIAVMDTNCDPDLATLPLPGNDDAIRAVNLFCETIADAVLEGRMTGEKSEEEEPKSAARAGEIEAAESADEETLAEEAAAEGEAESESEESGAGVEEEAATADVEEE